VLQLRAYNLSTAPLYVELNMPRQKPTISYDDQVTLIPKVAAEDTTLTVCNAVGGKTTFPIVSGTEIELDVVGLHYNRMLSMRCLLGGQFLIGYHSAVLEGSSQIYARAVPW
jgi:hypothetical protein